MEDGIFGSRQAPSLAQALYGSQHMMSQYQISPTCSTPNAYVVPSSRKVYATPRFFHTSNSAGCYLRCNPRVEEISENMAQSLPPPNPTRSTFDSPEYVAEVERKVCENIENALKGQYLRLKSKLRGIETRVQSTDRSIERLSAIVASIAAMVEQTNYPPAETPRPHRIVSGVDFQPRISWRRDDHQHATSTRGYTR